ncbi:hypothetical protein BJ508DRAFT_414109 [Ascobolus immersus RN42]|uniref:Chitin-binding type-2 domain-containing protein n=1 Tax=Ascobolus immersus RN42 TaxID=1160509 RepID=A0A3N4ILH9_ASCIM|nr:hypothetical protein BJ508DRAFT_414109 [Ascobolus immersus RN42]
MKSTVLISVFSSLLALVTAAPAPEPTKIVTPIPCDHPLHPCNRYHTYKQCSDLWLFNVGLCLTQEPHCIYFIRDPRDDCREKPKPTDI